MLCIEQNDEWLVGRGYLLAESISLVLTTDQRSRDNEIKKEVPEAGAEQAPEPADNSAGTMSAPAPTPSSPGTDLAVAVDIAGR